MHMPERVHGVLHANVTKLGHNSCGQSTRILESMATN